MITMIDSADKRYSFVYDSETGKGYVENIVGDTWNLERSDIQMVLNDTTELEYLIGIIELRGELY
jgi:hypothetical protein